MYSTLPYSILQKLPVHGEKQHYLLFMTIIAYLLSTSYVGICIIEDFMFSSSNVYIYTRVSINDSVTISRRTFCPSLHQRHLHRVIPLWRMTLTHPPCDL